MVTRNFMLIIVLILSVLPLQGQTPLNSINTTEKIEKQAEAPIYRLFPTENYWTFIKLDTRNGKMWQVHFSITEDGYEGELVLNADSLVLMTEEVNGRFTLYSTKNAYNFILLDQMNGKTYNKNARCSRINERKGS